MLHLIVSLIFLFFFAAAVRVSEVAVQAAGLLGAYLLLSRYMKERNRIGHGIISLLVLAVATAFLFSQVSSLLLIFYGTGSGAASASVWTIPLFLFFMVHGEMVRRSRWVREGLQIIGISFAFLIAAAASLFLVDLSFPVYPALALLVTCILFIFSGREAYRHALYLVEKLV